MQSVIATEIMGVARTDAIRRLLLAAQSCNNLLELISMFRVELNHTAGKKLFRTLVENVASAHASSHHIVEHVFSAYSRIISLAHELADNLHFLVRQGILGAESVHSHLRHSLENLIAITADI